MFKSIIRSIWIMLFASLILALFPCIEAQQGICPNYYGPFEPDLMGNESCQNTMPSGTFAIRWAHGEESGWNWQDWDQIDMKADTSYLLIYSATGDLSINETMDSSLNGYTMICCRNEGPDALVFCLKPSQPARGQEQERPGPGQDGPGQGGPR